MHDSRYSFKFNLPLMSVFPKYIFVFILFICTVHANGQDRDKSAIIQNTIEIDSVVIRARRETRNLMKRPYTEPNSLFSSISKLSGAVIKKQGAVNLIEAMNYVPDGLIESRGRQVKQFFSVRGQKYPYPDYAIDGVWQKEFE